MITNFNYLNLLLWCYIRPVFARPNGHCSNQSKRQDRNEINNNNNNNVKSNKNHYNNNNKLSNGGGGGGSSSSIGSNKSNKKGTSQSIPIQDNKSADNDVALEGATALSIDSQSSDQECQMRDEAQSGDLFLSLIEIFTESGDAISGMLQLFFVIPTWKYINLNNILHSIIIKDLYSI